MLRVISVASAACILGLVLAQTSNQPCWNHFVQTFSQCVQNATLSPQQLLYLTRNGSDGTAPPDLAAFKTQACSHKNDIFNCTLRVRNLLLNNSACVQSERTTINNFFTSVFQPYDIICAHPCRFTMMNSLGDCYTESKLDPELFMPNVSKPGGNVHMLGDTVEKVQAFCDVKEPLAQCMKREEMKCPESPIVMANFRLDLDSMETSINVLCSHPKVYLDTLKCFSSPSMEVRDCIDQQNRDVYDLGMKAERSEISQPDFLNAFCGLRLKYLICDLGAWKNHTLETCNPAVIGMKTELDCKLIPNECRATLGSKYDDVCAVKNFQKTPRDNYGKGSGVAVSPSVLPGMLLVIYYFLHSLYPIL